MQGLTKRETFWLESARQRVGRASSPRLCRPPPTPSSSSARGETQTVSLFVSSLSFSPSQGPTISLSATDNLAALNKSCVFHAPPRCRRRQPLPCAHVCIYIYIYINIYTRASHMSVQGITEWIGDRGRKSTYRSCIIYEEKFFFLLPLCSPCGAPM